MKNTTDYMRYGEFLNKPIIASPGGEPRMLETGGMYGGESLFSPQGDYGATNEDYHSQKGPMYEGYEGENISSEGMVQKYEPLPLPIEMTKGSSSHTDENSWWTPKRIMGVILMVISIYTLLKHPDSVKLS